MNDDTDLQDNGDITIQSLTALLEKTLSALERSEATIAELKRPAPSPPPPKPDGNWSFQVKRDNHDRIVSIVATPVPPDPYIP